MSRFENLKTDFNKFWQSVFKESKNEDLFYLMSIKDFVNLKKALTNINNILTLQTTNDFIKMLLNDNRISDELCKKILDEIDNINANSNGFDVECDDNDFPFVAEVKCNIPVKGNNFGAAQKNGIIKDIDGLLNSKSKSKLKKEEIDDFYKFLVLLEVENVRKSTENLIKSTPNIKRYKSDDKILQKDVVYIVFIKPDLKSA